MAAFLLTVLKKHPGFGKGLVIFICINLGRSLSPLLLLSNWEIRKWKPF
jgi:hypothetical protein